MTPQPGDATFEAGRAAFAAGVQAFEAGELARAETLFVESLRLVPGRASTLVNLAAVHHRLGREALALAALDQALAAQPDDAAAWFHRAQLLQVLARPHEALASYERVLALDATQGDAWTQRGSLLKDMGRLDEAAQCFGQALAHGGNEELNRYFLASVRRHAQGATAGSSETAAPATAPRRYVQALFDSYAEGFDEHLVGKLGYRIPWLIEQLLLRHGTQPAPPPGAAPGASGAAEGKRWHAALDLGCGTGLLGPRLAPHCTALDGVDLSPAMLAKARALGCYRDLVHADIGEHLHGTGRRYDLVTAADVFVYVGALEAVFAGVARVLDAGGLFAFSLEEADTGAARYELRASSRYAHAEGYVRGLAAALGAFEWLAAEHTTLRHEQRQPIAGRLVLLRRR